MVAPACTEPLGLAITTLVAGVTETMSNVPLFPGAVAPDKMSCAPASVAKMLVRPLTVHCPGWGPAAIDAAAPDLSTTGVDVHSCRLPVKSCASSVPLYRTKHWLAAPND